MLKMAEPTDKGPFLECERDSANFTRAASTSIAYCIKEVRVRVERSDDVWLVVTPQNVRALAVALKQVEELGSCATCGAPLPRDCGMCAGTKRLKREFGKEKTDA